MPTNVGDDVRSWCPTGSRPKLWYGSIYKSKLCENSFAINNNVTDRVYPPNPGPAQFQSFRDESRGGFAYSAAPQKTQVFMKDAIAKTEPQQVFKM